MDGSFDNDLPHFQAIINKYENLFEELSQELLSVKSEHDIVKSKLSTLVKENQELRKELSKSQTYDKPSVENDEIIDCLKEQIRSLLSEKDNLKKLWINANKTIELLEGELRVYQSGDLVPKTDVLKVKENYEKRLHESEQKLQFAQKSSKVPTENNVENPLKICQSISLENQEGALKIVKNLEEEVLALQKRLQESEKTVAKLQKILKEKDDTITKVSTKNVEYRDKVSEAIEVVHAALNEKDAALFREKEARDEIEKVSQELADIMKETEEKIKNEVAKVKNEYLMKEENFQMELKNLRNELSVKSLEIEKYCTKNALLENELDRFRKGNISMDDMNASKLLILEKNLESTFQKLLLSEKNNIQLASEKETIKNDMAQMAEHYERIVKTKEVEKLSFENRIKQVQNDLEETKISLKNIKEQLELEKEQKKLIEKEYLERIEEQEKTLTKKFAGTLSEATASFNEKMAKLQRHLEMKDELNKKWSVETKDIVKKLENFIGELKKELRRSRKENNKLRSQLDYEKKRFEQYKYFLKIIASDVDHSNGVVQENVGTAV